jgi:glyoxylase-like metal-dependent hydrolase (beta-lactamase superfamily II)
MLVAHDTDLWSTEYQLGWPVGFVPIPVRMTIVRLGDGRLILHSPGPIAPALRDELAGLGPVGFVVVPHMHGKFAAEAAQQYPDAQLVAAQTAPRKRRALAFHALLGDEPPAAWAGCIESHRIRGFGMEEVVLFHRPSRTLVVTDLCFNIQDSSSRVARLVFRANGMWKHFGPSRILRRAVLNRAAFEQSLEHVLRWDFERILPGHGDVIEHGGREALRAAWAR